MADSESPIKRIESHDLLEIAELSLGTTHRQILIGIDDRDSRRVISSVFEFAKSLDEERDNLFVSYVSYDSAHNYR
jgi:hypothetical protein